MITQVLAQSTVSDLAVAEDWYTRLFGRGPDTRPMDGLLEWHFGDSIGLQVFAEPDRAGHSSTVFGETDLDALAATLAANGIENAGPEQATSSRIVALSDPDGNRVVFTGP